MARVRQNFFTGTLSAELTIGGTSLSCAALASFPAVASPDVAYLVIDPDGATPEIVKVTVHASSGTTATIVRAQYSTAARAWPVGTTIIQAPLAGDADAAFLNSSTSSDAVLDIRTSGDANPRIQVKADGSATWQSALRSPYTGTHVNGAASNGSDTQLYIERNADKSSIVTIQMNRPGSLTGTALPSITSGNSFPITSGTVTVDDASLLASTSAGPAGVSSAVVQFTGFADDFTRADSASTLGASWTAVASGVWGISSNQAYNVAGDGGAAPTVAYYETGVGQQYVSCTMSAASSSDANGSGFVINYADTNNYISIRWNHSAATWDVYKKVSGTLTFLLNSGGVSSGVTQNATIRARVTAAGYLYVYFSENGAVNLANVGTGFLSNTKVGLITGSATAGSTMRWDDFSVQSYASCSWTGKTGNDLTGFTCSGVTGTADTTWKILAIDGTAANLLALYDSYGAPITKFKSYGGQHTTDNVTMGASETADVGMSFIFDATRTVPGLILYGDDGPSGAGWDSRKGLALWRTAAYNAALGGRLRIRPADITNSSGVALAGSAASPHLQIGQSDTGLYLKTVGPDTIGVSLDGTLVLEIAAAGLKDGTGAPLAQPQPPVIPMGGTTQALSMSMAAVSGATFVLRQADFTIPSGYTLQARVVAMFDGHTSGDQLEVQLYDEVGAAVLAAAVTETTVSSARARAASAWVNVPSTAARGVARARNVTAARGNVKNCWIELKFT